MISTVWLRNEGELYRPLQVNDLVIEPEFPLFKTLSQETAYQRNERWKNERSSLSIRQQQFVTHRACKAFANAITMETNDVYFRASVAAQLNRALHIPEIFTNVEYSNVVCGESFNPPSVIKRNAIIVRVDYKFHTSFTDHHTYICNQQP